MRFLTSVILPVLASGCVSIGAGDPCPRLPDPGEVLEERLYSQAETDPELSDWLERLKVLAVLLKECE